MNKPEATKGLEAATKTMQGVVYGCFSSSQCLGMSRRGHLLV